MYCKKSVYYCDGLVRMITALGTKPVKIRKNTLNLYY